jgi:Xaa-Pro dipeptidase
VKRQVVFAARLKRLREAIGDSGLDGVMMVPGPNIRYLTDVDSFLMERPFLLFVPVEGETQLVAPALEAGPYRNCPLDMSIHDWTDSAGPALAMAEAVKSLAAKKRWGIEGRVPFQFLSIFMKQSSANLRDAEPVLQNLRGVKDAEEVSLLSESARILSRSFDEAPQLIREGMTELELARKLQDLIYSKGATFVSELLVQSGSRAANPHSLASSKRIKRGETIVLDLVSGFEGYHADITRTFCLGNSSLVESIYGEVLEAQSRAIAAAGEGVCA